MLAVIEEFIVLQKGILKLIKGYESLALKNGSDSGKESPLSCFLGYYGLS